MKDQVKKHFKIDNSIKKQNPKISKSNLSKFQKDKRDNMLGIVIQTSLFLLLSIIIKIVGNSVVWELFSKIDKNRDKMDKIDHNLLVPIKLPCCLTTSGDRQLEPHNHILFGL